MSWKTPTGMARVRGPNPRGSGCEVQVHIRIPAAAAGKPLQTATKYLQITH